MNLKQKIYDYCLTSFYRILSAKSMLQRPDFMWGDSEPLGSGENATAYLLRQGYAYGQSLV